MFGITGTAVGSTALSQCQVFVIANSVKPYQPATATGPGGAADYSKWNFVLPPNILRSNQDQIIKLQPNIYAVIILVQYRIIV